MMKGHGDYGWTRPALQADKHICRSNVAYTGGRKRTAVSADIVFKKLTHSEYKRNFRSWPETKTISLLLCISALVRMNTPVLG